MKGSLIKFLVDQDEDVNKPELSGLTPLHFASRRGYLWNVSFGNLAARDRRETRLPLRSSNIFPLA
jgi:ankyrin repeat protein